MSCSIDWPSWITAAATVATAFIYFRLNKLQRGQLSILSEQKTVQKQQLDLVASVENQKLPFCHIWYNGTGAISKDLNQSVKATFSLINTGGSPFVARTVRLLEGKRSAAGNKSLNIEAALIQANWLDSVIPNKTQPQVLTDLIVPPCELVRIEFVPAATQYCFEFMYHDGSFEFIDIDTMNLGGKYTVTGKGVKP